MRKSNNVINSVLTLYSLLGMVSSDIVPEKDQRDVQKVNRDFVNVLKRYIEEGRMISYAYSGYNLPSKFDKFQRRFPRL